MKYELVEYDVWGNEVDGFEVNDAIKTGVEYEIDERDSDEEIIRKLCQEEKKGFFGLSIGTWLKPDAETEVEINSLSTTDMIMVDNKSTGEPLGRLELVK